MKYEITEFDKNCNKYLFSVSITTNVLSKVCEKIDAN